MDRNLPEKHEDMIVLDVRPDVESGVDPFVKIMNTVDNLKDSEGLHLINSFEPVPLYTVMKMKGFDHSMEYKDGSYHIYFSRAEDVKKESSQVPESEEEKLIEIDVRGLEPPEPMVKIIEKLPEVDSRTVLLVHHHREPFMLYDKLEHLGFEASTEKVSEGYYRVKITKKR